MNNMFWVRIEETNQIKLINKLYSSDIYYEDLKKDNKYIYLKVDLNNYNRLKKYLITYNITIHKLLGPHKYIKLIKNNLVFYITFIISIILLIIINNMSFNIIIKTNDTNIYNIVLNSLYENNINKVSFKKNHKDIEKIINNILINNRDTLEWLEIKYDGLNMVVLVTERVYKNNKESNSICNVVAKSDGKVVSYNVKKGEVVTRINEYVYKGDLLISGFIKNNEEVKDKVCASGDVYASIWYKVNLSIPLNKEVITKTNKSKYNIRITTKNNKYKILRSRFSNYKESITNLYSLNNFKIDLVKETKTSKKIVTLSEVEALNYGLKLVENKMKLKLKENEYIIEKKVLKNTIKDSTMLLEVFVVTKENISEVVTVEEGSNNDQSDTRKST